MREELDEVEENERATQRSDNICCQKRNSLRLLDAVKTNDSS